MALSIVNQVNFRDPRTGAWFEVAQSQWIGAAVRPFEFTISDSFYDGLREMEVVVYDIEDGSGTAKILLGWTFIPDERCTQRLARCTIHFKAFLLLGTPHTPYTPLALQGTPFPLITSSSTGKPHT